MKVCIPIETRPAGGGFYFIESLRAYLNNQQIAHTKYLNETYDILFLNAWHVTYYQAMKAFRVNPNVRLVHRVDGAGQDYGRPDNPDAIQRRVSRLADRTIFQSAYCRYSTREKFDVITQTGPVIWNPVDVETFTPEGPRRDLPGRIKVCYVTFSQNPLKGAPDLYRVAEASPDVDFILCGRYDHPPEMPNLHLVGLLGRKELAIVLRSSDVFLTFSQNEACPNVVLEAMSTGLPILYRDSGAARELVRDAGLAVTAADFRSQLAVSLANRSALGRRGRELALQDFHPSQVFARYLSVMQEALSSPPRVSLPERKRRTILALATRPVEEGWISTRTLRRRVRGKLRTMFGSR